MSDPIMTTAEAVEAAALPRARAVTVDPETLQTAEQQPLPASVAKRPVEQKSPAEWAYERIVLYIKNFEETLASEEEVAMGFVGGDMGVLRIQGIGFFAPDLITFYGADESGARTQLVQHVSQLNLMLRATPKPAAQSAPTRIGFRLAQDLENQSQ